MPQAFTLSFWILLGLGVLGLPHTTQRCMGYRDSRAMHDAMVIGTLLIGFMILCSHLAGTFGRAVFPDLPADDLAMPTMILEQLFPMWAGVFIAGPLAAIISTVDSMLLLISAAIIKDLYIRFKLKGNSSRMPVITLKRASTCITAIDGLVAFVAALEPPDLLVWINLFAFGGLEAAFLCPIVMGQYCESGNSRGAVASIIFGVTTFRTLSIIKPAMGGIHAIVPTTQASISAYLIGSYLGRCPHESRNSSKS